MRVSLVVSDPFELSEKSPAGRSGEVVGMQRLPDGAGECALIRLDEPIVWQGCPYEHLAVTRRGGDGAVVSSVRAREEVTVAAVGVDARMLTRPLWGLREWRGGLALIGDLSAPGGSALPCGAGAGWPSGAGSGACGRGRA